MPMVAAVAAPDPLMAAKKAQARMVAMPSPPGRCRTQTFITSKRSSPTRPSSRRRLIRMKSGMAMTTKLSSEVNMVLAMSLTGRSNSPTSRTDVAPSENATGKPAKRTVSRRRVTQPSVIMRVRLAPLRRL